MHWAIVFWVVDFSLSQEKAAVKTKCWYNLLFFFSQNRYEEAVKCYNECIDIDPENVAVYTNRALCYLRLNQVYIYKYINSPYQSPYISYYVSVENLVVHQDCPCWWFFFLVVAWAGNGGHYRSAKTSTRQCQGAFPESTCKKGLCHIKNKISGMHVSKKTRGKSLVTRHFLFRSLSLIGWDNRIFNLIG